MKERLRQRAIDKFLNESFHIQNKIKYCAERQQTNFVNLMEEMAEIEKMGFFERLKKYNEIKDQKLDDLE